MPALTVADNLVLARIAVPTRTVPAGQIGNA